MQAVTTKYLKWPAFALILLLIIVVYTFYTLHLVHAAGEQDGIVRQIAKVGFICKTYEGELVVSGSKSEKFFFTAKSEAIYNKIKSANKQRIKLFYKQHNQIPTTCFGDTEYFVYDVRVLDSQNANGH